MRRQHRRQLALFLEARLQRADAISRSGKTPDITPHQRRLAELCHCWPDVGNDAPICLSNLFSATLRNETLTFGDRSKCEVKGFIAPEAMKRRLKTTRAHEVARRLLS